MFEMVAYWVLCNVLGNGLGKHFRFMTTTFCLTIVYIEPSKHGEQVLENTEVLSAKTPRF